MSIKLVKPAPSAYSMTCPKCGALFTYEIDDVNKYGLNSGTVVCPSCGNGCYHPSQRGGCR